MTPEEQARFLNLGRDFATQLAQVADHLAAYAASFEARGGAAALGEFGNDSLAIVYLNNDLQTWLTPERKAILARLRTDY